MLKSKKALVSSVLCAVASAGFVASASAADTTMQGDLAEVVVEGKRSVDSEYAGGFVGRGGDIGILGRQDYMSTPMQVTSITAKAIDSVKLPGQTLTQAVTLDPAVRARGGNAYNDISIRGYSISPHDYYVDGIYGLMCQSSIPTNWLERIDVISGPSTFTHGGSSAGKSVSGAIDLIPKKAKDDPTLNFTETFSGRGNWTEAVDIGQRFGKDKEWGVRVNGAYSDGETFRKKEDMTMGNIFVDIDYNKKNTRANFFYGHTHVKEMAPDLPLKLGKFNVPSAPKLSTNFQASWTDYSYNTDILGISFEHDFNKNFTWFLKAGYQDEDWYSCFESYYPTLVSDKGDFESYIEQVPIRLFRKSASTGAKLNFETGKVKHNVVVSADKSWKSGYWGDWAAGYDYIYNGNIYDNSIEQSQKPSVDHLDWGPYAKQTSYGISFIDKLEAGKFTTLLGLRHQKDHTSGAYKGSANAPSLGLMYKFDDKLAAYGNWIQGITPGVVVGSRYKNKGDILDPVKTTQRELGVKWDNGNIGGTASYFYVNQMIAVADNNNVLGYDGHQMSKGFQLNTFGESIKGLHLLGGFMYMESTNKGGSYDGLYVNSQPKWNATLGMEYDINDRFALTSRAVYNGSSWADSSNTKRISPWTRLDLGAKYTWKQNNKPITLALNVYNVLDHRYWYGNGNNTIMLGTPRTAVLSLSMDF